MSNRTILINNYLNLIEENNSNITQLITMMNNQENTLRRLIFENDDRLRSVYTPSLTNLVPSRINRTRVYHSNGTNTNNTLRQMNNRLDSLFNVDNVFDTILENVPVIPTRQQIDNALRHNIYSEIENPINTTCPISLRRFQNDDEVSVIRHCNHVFMRDDLNSWFRNNTRCPLCRFDIRTYNSRNN